MILEEYDECKTSTFDPNEVENVVPGFPETGICMFSKKLLDSFLEKWEHEIVSYYSNANGKNPIYKIKYGNKDIAIFTLPVGAPTAVVTYEEILAKGLKNLVVFGTCGALDSSIKDLSIIIPNYALRDEGTSYHYLPASREIVVNKKYTDKFMSICDKHNYSYTCGKTWTIDAPYRETRDKVAKRKSEGCICVEMECASLFAVSYFRDTNLFQFFYAADNLDAAKWDKRSLGNDDKLSEKEKVVVLALELAKEMD